MRTNHHTQEHKRYLKQGVTEIALEAPERVDSDKCPVWSHMESRMVAKFLKRFPNTHCPKLSYHWANGLLRIVVTPLPYTIEVGSDPEG